MAARAVTWTVASTSLALLLGCGGAQEAGRYDYSVASAPYEEAQVSVGSGGGALASTPSRDESYDFEDDVVEGELVNPGDMARGRTVTEAPPPPPSMAPVTLSSTPAPAAVEERSSRRADRSRSRESSRRRRPTKAAPSRPAPSGAAAAAPSADDSGVAFGGEIALGASIAQPPEPAPVVYQVVQHLSRLTAASVGDADRRGPYLEYLARHPAEAAQIGLDMTRRVRVRVLDAQSRPLHDAAISLNVGGRTVQGRTHADGYWDFFPGVSAPGAMGQAPVSIAYRGHSAQTSVTIPGAGDATDLVIQLPGVAAVAPSTLDLAFLIDVTGSMGDELAYVNHELMGIVQQVRAAIPQVNVRLAATLYRDRGDMQPLEQIDFTGNVNGFLGQLGRIQANGGGDYPEDLNNGLESAVQRLSWSTGQAARVLVVIADAPPQRYPDAQYTYHHALLSASARGIRVLPVAASGADRVVEYLFRAMGAFTSTPYVYLTDDSGVGGHHMEADTDRIHVEMFSELLTRLLIADMQGQGMHEPSHADQGQGMLGLVR